MYVCVYVYCGNLAAHASIHPSILGLWSLQASSAAWKSPTASLMLLILLLLLLLLKLLLLLLLLRSLLILLLLFLLLVRQPTLLHLM